MPRRSLPGSPSPWLSFRQHPAVVFPQITLQDWSDRDSRMVVLRLVGILVLIAIGASLVLYLFTRNRRYLGIAWRIFQLAVVFLMVFMALYVLERLVLIA
jgi:hypothetical protein